VSTGRSAAAAAFGVRSVTTRSVAGSGLRKTADLDRTTAGFRCAADIYDGDHLQPAQLFESDARSAQGTEQGVLSVSGSVPCAGAAFEATGFSNSPFCYPSTA